MSTAPASPAPAPKESWLKRFGHVLGKILGFVATQAAPIADQAAKVAEALLPQFSAEIQIADNLVSKIAREAILAEGVAQAAGTTSGGGAQKLEAVLKNIGPAIDGWITANFPGSKALSDAAKAGLVNAVVAILNEIDPSAVGVVPTAKG